MDTLIEGLEGDHKQLVGAMEAVDLAVAAFDSQPDGAHQAKLHHAMVAVREMFFPHLDVEDAQILPAIAESMPPEQWDRLDKEALKSIPRKNLPLAVGALDNVIGGMAKENRPPPPPPPLPLRLMLALSWRNKWSAWMKPLLV